MGTKLSKNIKIIVIIFVGISYFSCGLDQPFMEGIESKVTLKFPGTDLTLESRVWGIAGNHEVISIREANESQLDSSKFQVFYTSEIYYRKNGANALEVYVDESSFNKLLDSIGNIKLNVITLDNFDSLQNLAQDYKSKGLIKLSAYDSLKE